MRAPATARPIRLAVALAGLLGCKSAPTAVAAPEPGPLPPSVAAEGSGLPPTMLGTFVPEGGDHEGRVLIVSESMIAAIRCADCGVPNYFHFDTITCTGGSRCEVSGVECSGTLTLLEQDTLEVSARPQADGAAPCDAYAGRFVPGETIGTHGAVVPTSQAPRGQVLVAGIRSPREVDLDAARLMVEANVDALDACYQRALELVPGLAGTLEVEVVHGARGEQASPSKVREPELHAPDMVACIERTFAGWSFPVPADGLPAPVYYTLAFVLR